MFLKEPKLPDPSRFDGHNIAAAMLQAIANFHVRERTHMKRALVLSQERYKSIGDILDSAVSSIVGGDPILAFRAIQTACTELIQIEFETTEHILVMADSTERMAGDIQRATVAQ